MFRNDVQCCFFAHFGVFSLAFTAYIINKCSMTDGIKRAISAIITDKKPEKFEKKIIFGVAGQICILYNFVKSALQ